MKDVLQRNSVVWYCKNVIRNDILRLNTTRNRGFKHGFLDVIWYVTVTPGRTSPTVRLQQVFRPGDPPRDGSGTRCWPHELEGVLPPDWMRRVQCFTVKLLFRALSTPLLLIIEWWRGASSFSPELRIHHSGIRCFWYYLRFIDMAIHDFRFHGLWDSPTSPSLWNLQWVCGCTSLMQGVDKLRT